MLKILQSCFVPPRDSVHFLPVQRGTASTKIGSRGTLEMRIVPCSAVQMSVLAPRKVSAQQWGAYWGVNKMERLQKVLESLLVAYGGAWMSWFLSMLAGNVISSFTGTALIFNWMYSPWLNAKKRNAKIWRAGNQKLSYALYIGRIVSLKRVKRRAGKTIGAVSQEFLVMTVEDERQRQLEIVTQWQEPYSKLRLHMRCENIIASSKKDFSVLNMVTDSWIPACGVWVGDYPYLDRGAFRDFVSTVEPVNRKEVSRGQQPIPNEDFPKRSQESSQTSRRKSDDHNRYGEKMTDEIYSDEYINDPYGDPDPEYTTYSREELRDNEIATSPRSSVSESFRNGEASDAIDWEVYFEEKEAFSSGSTASDDIPEDDLETEENLSSDDINTTQPKRKRFPNDVSRIEMQTQRRSTTPRRPP